MLLAYIYIHSYYSAEYKTKASKSSMNGEYLMNELIWAQQLYLLFELHTDFSFGKNSPISVHLPLFNDGSNCLI